VVEEELFTGERFFSEAVAPFKEGLRGRWLRVGETRV